MNPTEAGSNTHPPPRRSRMGRPLAWLGGLLLAYLLAAYGIVPGLWRRAVQRDPGLTAAPRLTHTANGIPGDPLNLALIGSETNLVLALTASHWYPADPITLRTSLRIAVDTVFRRPDERAPVSDLFLFGRKQDVAFEQPVGDSPRQRHHVRFWRWDREEDGRPVWFGSATFDERVGLSHTTGQITHHIGPDVDAERDRLLTELQQSGWAQRTDYVDGFHPVLEGRNGGGDPWRTDGRLGVAVLKPTPTLPAAATQPRTPP